MHCQRSLKYVIPSKAILHILHISIHTWIGQYYSSSHCYLYNNETFVLTVTGMNKLLHVCGISLNCSFQAKNCVEFPNMNNGRCVFNMPQQYIIMTIMFNTLKIITYVLILFNDMVKDNMNPPILICSVSCFMAITIITTMYIYIYIYIYIQTHQTLSFRITHARC